MADAAPTGRIGPNALTQLLPPLEALGGAALRDDLLRRAGVVRLPDMSGLIDEVPVARLHHLVRIECPDRARTLAQAAGTGTAQYVIANRIPAPARTVLRLSPHWISARLLATAIARNAWTFAGSGSFRVVSKAPVVFEIVDNPLIRGEEADHPICHWHTAVFEGLYRSLVSPRFRVTETQCAAQGGNTCRFEVTAV